jgi:hypothetical protein
MTEKELIKENELMEREQIENEQGVSHDENLNCEKTTEENFDGEIIELIKEINRKIRSENNLLIVFQSNQNEEPIVVMNGHPYDVVAMTSGFIREVKSKLISDIEC